MDDFDYFVGNIPSNSNWRSPLRSLENFDNNLTGKTPTNSNWRCSSRISNGEIDQQSIQIDSDDDQEETPTAKKYKKAVSFYSLINLKNGI